MKVKEGLASHSLPAGRRELRPPRENKYNPVTQSLQLAVVAVLALVCGLAAATWRKVCSWLFKEPLSIKGRVCFVTGSGRGLGREICLELVRNGAFVACADVNEATNEETLELIKKLGGKAKGYKLNVANKQEVEEIARRVERELGPVYLVVNNAAIVMALKDPTEEYVRAMFNVNVLGYIWVAEAFLPYLKARNAGHIVNIGSIAGYHGVPVLSIYCSSKAAVRNWSKSLSISLQIEDSNNKVRVSCISPTFINTSQDYEDMVKFRITYSPLKPVLDDLMYVVKNDRNCDFTTPFYMKPVLLLVQVLPEEIMHFVIKFLNVTALVPTREEFENLPHGRLVRLCSGAGSTKEDTIKNGDLKKDK